MTTDPLMTRPDPRKVRAFKVACRQVLKDLGIVDVRFKTSKLTGNPIISYSMEAARAQGIDLGKVDRSLIKLADEFGVDSAYVPAEYYQLPIG